MICDYRLHMLYYCFKHRSIPMIIDTWQISDIIIKYIIYTKL